MRSPRGDDQALDRLPMMSAAHACKAPLSFCGTGVPCGSLDLHTMRDMIWTRRVERASDPDHRLRIYSRRRTNL
jgi:hypothetical protein